MKICLLLPGPNSYRNLYLFPCKSRLDYQPPFGEKSPRFSPDLKAPARLVNLVPRLLRFLGHKLVAGRDSGHNGYFTVEILR